tara:strand:+ start:52 stop:1320 length:1269 start_codon:yes stop_codon:yes gene_type:complete
MGTGKTASAIWASDYLISKGYINRVLVICPLSVMDSVWRGDLFKFAMHRKVDIAFGSKEKRKKIIASKAEYVIINYDGIDVVFDAVKNGGFDLIIIDEANAYKNTSTKRWKLINKLITPTKWLWMMTGSPAAQSPVDAYGLAKLVNPNNVPRYAGTFKEGVMYRLSQFRWMPKPNAKQVVFRALQPAIRFTKKECLDLPEIMTVRRTIPLTRQQEKYYKILKENMLMRVGGEAVTAVNAAVSVNKLLQVSQGAVYTDEHNILEFDMSNRYQALHDILEESTKKVIVFVPFKHVIKILMQKLKKDNIAVDFIDGSVPVSKRTSIFSSFQNSDTPELLLLQPATAAHGITLTAANTVVWWGVVSSLETYSQANARIHRAGQDEPCTIVQLAGSRVERNIYDMLDKRIDVHKQMISLYENISEVA